MSKNIPLFDFAYTTEEVVTPDAVVDIKNTVELLKIYDENAPLLPKGLKEPNNDNVFEWLEKRKAPKHRQYIENLISLLDENGNPLKYLEVTSALSLNDAYWVKASDDVRAWKEVNFYNNNYDERISYIALTGSNRKYENLHASPEFTTGGQQRKCWRKSEGENHLIKGFSGMYQSGNDEVVNEIFTAQIAAVLGFNHVKYFAAEFTYLDNTKEVVSSCPIFTTENIGYIPIHDLTDIRNELDFFETQISLAQIYGKEAFEDMMLFDAIIMNTDRNFSNFGMLVNNDTGEIIAPAPLFDHANSLFIGIPVTNQAEMEKLVNTRISFFGNTFDVLMKRYAKPRHQEALERLKDITLSPIIDYLQSEKYAKIVTQFVRQRAITALKNISQTEFT